MPYDIVVLSWLAGEKYLTEKEKKLKVLKHKFKYDGYHLYAIENMINYNSNPAYSNIHLFNELAELKHEIEFFLIRINLFFADDEVWEFNNKDTTGFLKLVNFNNDS